MPNINRIYNALVTQSNWLHIGSLVLVLILVFLIGRLVCVIIRKSAHRKSIVAQPIFHEFLMVLSKSITFLMLGVGFWIGVAYINASAEVLVVLEHMAKVLMVVSVGYFAYLMVEIPGVWFEQIIKKSESDSNKMFLPALRRTLRVFVVIFVLFQVAQILSEKSITSIIAGLGIGGLAIALAAQDTIKHFIGSFVIAGDKPFEIGERVVVDGHDGTIETIGLRSTRIRTLNGHYVSIPNGELANRTIQNIGKRPFIKNEANIGITYDTPPEKVEQAINIIKELLDNHEGMDEEFPPRVYFNRFDAYSLNIIVLYWYHPPNYWDYMAFNEKFNFQLLQQFNEAGIDFAFPSQTLFIEGDHNHPGK